MLALRFLALAAAIGAHQPLHAETSTKLTGAELQSTFVGKTYEFRTTKVPSRDVHRAGDPVLVERTDGGWAVFRVFVRSDGSLIFRCTTHIRGGPGTPCPSRVEDVGTGSIEGDKMCSRYTSVRGGVELCYEYYREGTSLRAKQVRGARSTMDGELIVFK
jgi:hypothetical protein